MKTTRLLFLLPMLLLTACPEKGGSSHATKPSLKVALCQPDKPEAVPPLMESLRTTLKEQVWAKQRSLELQILLSDGTAQPVPAPTEKGWMEKIFGPSTPEVREQKLTAHLAVLEARLKGGCTTPPMSLATLKAAPTALYAGEGFIVWSTHGGTKNPWAQERQKPLAFVSDTTALDTALHEQQTQNLLVLTTPLAMPVAKERPIKTPAAKIAPKTKAKPAPAAIVEQKAAPPSAAPVGGSTGSTLVFNLGDQAPQNPTVGAESLQTLGVPDNAEYFETILHDVGSSSPKDKQELERIAGELKRLMQLYEFRIVLHSRADAVKGSTPDRNRELSEQRACVCKVALIELGVPVYETSSVGDALAGGASDMDRGTRIYLVNKTPKPGTKINQTAKR